jgi:outer membrane protein OmpA-like peptidoglycan-associated protein
MKKYFYLLLAGLLMVSVQQQVVAREYVRVYKRAPSAAELASVLGIKAKPTSVSKRRTRRIVFDSTPPPSQTNSSSPQQRKSSSGPSEQVLAFPIYFRSGSAKLTPQAKPFIKSIASLMKMDSSLRFQIEGHTDSRGSAARNLKLSQDRADSVMKYLINRHSIDASRLNSVGKGSQEPLKGVSPRDRANRRVQFRKMG